MTGVKLPEGADVDDLLDELVLLKGFGFDENEHETMKMMRDGKRLAAPRQLGDWITIDINATKNQLRAISNDATHTESARGCPC